MFGPDSVAVSDALENAGVSRSKFVVNIGCHDGKSWDDPCFPLFQRGYPGLAIDGGNFPAIHENLPNDNVTKLMRQKVLPNNAAHLLRKNGCPDAPHMITVDIDSYDRDVLVSILKAGIRPEFFQVEIQPEFPPPVVFSILYHPLYKSPGGYGGFYGCSISAIEIIARKFGYQPITLDMRRKGTHDMVFLRYDLLAQAKFTEINSMEAYRNEPPKSALHFLDIGIDSRRWQGRSDYTELLGEMFLACTLSSQARTGLVVPFELGLDWQRI